jgi:hypothetical protein
LAAGVTVAVAGFGYAAFARRTFEVSGEVTHGWDVVFDVITNPLFLGQIVLAVWTSVTVADLRRAIEPQRAIRAGSRTAVLERDLTRGAAQLLIGAVLLLIAIGIAALGVDWDGWGGPSLAPMFGLTLARAGWAPLPLLAVSVAQAVACFLALRAVAAAITAVVGSIKPAIAVLIGFWFLEALSSLYISAEVPILRYLGPIFSTERVAPLGISAAAVIGGAVFVVGACWAIAVTRDRAPKPIRLRTSATPVLAWTAFIALAFAIGIESMSRRPSTLVEAWSTLTTGRSPDLLAYSLSALVALGYAVGVVHRLETQLEGRVWVELIRLGSWRRWLHRHLIGPLLLIPVYLAVLLLASGITATATFAPDFAREAITAAIGYLLNGTLQITVYTGIAVAVALITGEARIAWIALGAVFLLGTPFVPHPVWLPVGAFHFDPTLVGLLRQAAVLITWIAAGIGGIAVLTRKRVLHVAA